MPACGDRHHPGDGWHASPTLFQSLSDSVYTALDTGPGRLTFAYYLVRGSQTSLSLKIIWGLIPRPHPGPIQPESEHWYFAYSPRVSLPCSRTLRTTGFLWVDFRGNLARTSFLLFILRGLSVSSADAVMASLPVEAGWGHVEDTGRHTAKQLERWGCHGAGSELGTLVAGTRQSQSSCSNPAGLVLAVEDMQKDASLASA